MKLSTKQLLKVIWDFSKPFRKSFLITLILIVMMTSIDAVNSFFISKVFDSLQTKTSLNSTLLFCVFSFIMVTIRIILNRIKDKVEIEKLDVYITNHLNHHVCSFNSFVQVILIFINFFSSSFIHFISSVYFKSLQK